MNMNKIYLKKIAGILSIALAVMTIVSCVDLAELNEDPYSIPDKETEEIETGDDGTKYNDINLNFAVSKEDSAKYAIALAGAPETFRSLLYESYYAQYQITTNLSHDIYGGYVANNQPSHAGKTPDYAYGDGWSGQRWNEFYAKRSTEYRDLLRAFKFNDTPEKYKNMFYITRIYYVFAALANTDTYGDMPFLVYASGRLPETNNVKYESQDSVYDAMFRMLEQAVDSIQPNDDDQYKITQDDICYFGDVNKWLRFANTLRLRMALRISNVDPERAKFEGEAALNNQYGLMTSNSDNMQTVPKYAPIEMGGMDTGGDENALAMCSVCYGGESVMSKDLENFYRNLSNGGKTYRIKQGRNDYIEKQIDPRCLVCWFRSGMTSKTISEGEDSEREDYIGCPRGAQAPDIDMSTIPYCIVKAKPKSKGKDLDPLYWFNFSRPTVWLGYAESLFLKAEAALRGWKGTDLVKNEEEYMLDGIKASMDYYQIDAADADKYIEGLSWGKDADGDELTNPFEGDDKELKLKWIITHKWMAVFPNGNEAWAEFRRTDYPELMNQLTNRSGGDVPEGKNIKRILYPNSERDNKYFQENSDLQTKNTQGTRLWWDVADTNDDSGNRVTPNNFR